jgi:hypothetical protein
MILFTSVHILLFVHTHTTNDDFLKCFQVIKLKLQNQYFSLALVEKLNDDDVMMTIRLSFREF